jgi:hypothetical protein
MRELTSFESGVTKFFQQSANAALASKPPIKSVEVVEAMQAVSQLARDYESLKVEVFQRADRSTWGFLSNVYDYVLRINKSPQKRQIKTDLIGLINAREGAKISMALSIENLVVRYVFDDMTRQSRNNYVLLIQKALGMDIQPGMLMPLLEEHGGIVNVIEKDFDGNTPSANADSALRKLQRVDSANLLRRLFYIMSTQQEAKVVQVEQVANWAPSAQALSKLKASEKDLPKNQPGDFVFFVAVPGATPGEYNLLQGFSPTRDFEDQFLLQIAGRLGVSNEQLQVFISQIESSLPN